MSHERALESIVESLFGTLDADERQALDEHLASCEACAAERDAYHRMWADLGWAVRPDLPEAERLEIRGRARERLIEGIREFEKDTGGEIPAPRGRPSWIAPALRAAAMVTLLVVGAVVGRNWPAGDGVVDDAAVRDDVTTAEDALAGAPQFFFLLRTPTESLPPDEAEQLSTEMMAWVGDLEAGNRLVTGERLAETVEGWVAPDDLPPLTGDVPPRRGFMVIRAADFDEARRIAATSPSLEYGGAIEVLPLR